MKEIKITENIFALEGFPDGSRAVIVSGGQSAVLINPPAVKTREYEEFLSKRSIRAIYAFNSVYEAGGLLCGIQAVPLQAQKNKEETVFYLRASKVLIAGEVLNIKAGKMEMHPEKNYPDYAKAQAGLRRLFSLNFEIYIPSKGEIIFDAYEKLERMFGDLK